MCCARCLWGVGFVLGGGQHNDREGCRCVLEEVVVGGTGSQEHKDLPVCMEPMERGVIEETPCNRTTAKGGILTNQDLCFDTKVIRKLKSDEGYNAGYIRGQKAMLYSLNCMT